VKVFCPEENLHQNLHLVASCLGVKVVKVVKVLAEIRRYFIDRSRENENAIYPTMQ